MATPTYDLLDSVTLSSSASSVTFSSIDQSYRDLVFVADVGADASNTTYSLLYFNGDTGSNYNRVQMYGTGSSALSNSASNAGWLDLFINLDAGSTQRGLIVVQIMDYSATDKHKSVLSRTTVPAKWTMAQAGRWASTSAISSIECSAYSSAQYPAGSTFYLYGIAG